MTAVCARVRKRMGARGDMGRTLDIRGRQDEAACCKLGEAFFKRSINGHVAVHAILCGCGWLCVDRHLCVVEDKRVTLRDVDT